MAVSGGLYNPYHLLGEPETAIDQTQKCKFGGMFQVCMFCKSVSVCLWCVCVCVFCGVVSKEDSLDIKLLGGSISFSHKRLLLNVRGERWKWGGTC